MRFNPKVGVTPFGVPLLELETDFYCQPYFPNLNS